MTRPHPCPECRQPLLRRHARPRLIGGIPQGRNHFVLFCRNGRCQLVVPDDFFLDPVTATRHNHPNGNTHPHQAPTASTPLNPTNNSTPTQAHAIASR